MAEKNIPGKVSKQISEKMKKNVNILAIFMGGDREVDISISEVASLSAAGFPVTVLMTKSAMKIIGENKVKACNPSKILVDSGGLDSHELAKSADIILIPVFTLNGLSKISNLIADSLHSNIIIQAIRRQIPIIAARESIICCNLPELPFQHGFMRKVEEMTNQARNFGIKVVPAGKISREVYEALDLPYVQTRPGAVKMQGNPAVSGSSEKCGLSKEECTTCGLCVVKKKEEVRALVNAGASRIGSTAKEGFDPDMAAMIDHTLLKPNAVQEEIVKLCEEAKKYKFATVCVNPAYVSLASRLLKGSGVGITTVIGFPLGATTPTVKAIEARDAIANGATEIDMVMNVGAMKSGNLQMVFDDIKAVREATRGYCLKVILETSFLTDEEVVQSSKLSKDAGADFVKTATGFGPGGATEKVIRLMRETVGPSLGVKASGGIRTQDDAVKMINAGASRVGASASVAIVTGKDPGQGKY